MDLHGIITPVFTPFHRDGEQSLNCKALESHIDYLLQNGVKGIFILGSNGEMHVINDNEKIQLARATVRYVNGRVPVFVGTGGNSTQNVINLTHSMEKIGIDAVSIVTPYFIKPTDKELVKHYRTIADNTSLPVILYNIPKNMGTNLSKEVVSQLANVENIIAIKDSSGDMENLKGYVEAADDRMEVLIGSDSKIVPALKEGAVGAIAGTSNIIPNHIVSTYNSFH